jgi:hypothetical protein
MKMIKSSKTLAALAVAALFPLGAAVAGDKDKSGSMGPSFDTLDVNRDGRISQAEAGVDASIVFSSADRNGDGYLDKTEWKNRDKGATPPTTPQPQSETMPPETSPSDRSTMPETPPVSEPKPDTETPRQ